MFVLAFDDHTRIKMAGRILATRPGQIFALSPDIPHTEMPGDLPPRYLAMMIDRDFWHEQLREYPEVEYMKLNGEFFEPSSDLLPTCRKFMIEYQNSGPGTETILHALSIELCHYLIRTIWRFAQPLKPVSSRFEIDRVVEFIHGNLERKITSGDMARIACMSQSNFTRVFRKEMGTSPYDYLLGSRLARAKKMLQAGEKPISDIAQECGFSSTSHFSAKFSKKYNLSPATYRKAFG